MKSKGWAALLMVAALLFSLAASGCDMIAREAKDAVEQGVEDTIKDQTGKDVNIDIDKGQVEIEGDNGSTKIGKDFDWPDSIPASVPEFTYGTINAIDESEENGAATITIGLTGIKEGALKKYKKELEDAGWEVAITNPAENSQVLGATKGKETIAVNVTEVDEQRLGGLVYQTKK